MKHLIPLFVILAGLPAVSALADLTPTTVSGAVFYDTNANNVRDEGEVGIPNVSVVALGDETGGTHVELSTTTGADGSYAFDPINTGNYAFGSGLPSLEFTWTVFSESATDVTGPTVLDFGLIKLGAGGAQPRDYWMSAAGQSLVGNDDIAMLAAFNLYEANGTTPFNPKNYAALKKWLAAPSATNITNQLSIDLAVLALNVKNNKVTGQRLIRSQLSISANIGGCLTVDQAISDANTALGGFTRPGFTAADYQKYLRQGLQQALLNRSFLQPYP